MSLLLRAALLFAVITPGLAVGQEKHLLRYKFQPGEFLHYEFQQEMTIEQQVADYKSVNHTVTEQARQFRVLGVDDQQIATLEPMIERMKYTSRQDDKAAVAFDSERDGDQPIHEKTMLTIGRPLLRMQVTSTGRCLKIQPLAHDVPGLKESAEKLDSRIQFLILLPETPVAVGESWKEEISVPLLLPSANGAINATSLTQDIKLKRLYQLTSVENGIATISLKTTPLTPINDPKLEFQLLQKLPRTDFQFDLAQGRIVSQVTIIEGAVVGAVGNQSRSSVNSKYTERLMPASTRQAAAPRPLPQ